MIMGCSTILWQFNGDISIGIQPTIRYGSRNGGYTVIYGNFVWKHDVMLWVIGRVDHLHPDSLSRQGCLPVLLLAGNMGQGVRTLDSVPKDCHPCSPFCNGTFLRYASKLQKPNRSVKLFDPRNCMVSISQNAMILDVLGTTVQKKVPTLPWPKWCPSTRKERLMFSWRSRQATEYQAGDRGISGLLGSFKGS